MLGVDVDCQARCFAHFSKVFDELISRDKSEARYDEGVVDIRANAITLKQKVPFFTEHARPRLEPLRTSGLTA